jgi:[ribosomal protein S5]-alanine N-acetyltransferase
MPETLFTPRLQLLELSRDQLEKCLTKIEALEAELGFPISRSNIDANVVRAIGMKMAKMACADAIDLPWLTYWMIVLKQPRFGAGMIGFKGAPDSSGCVEVGYGIDETHRNRGYVSEALGALVSWAFRHAACRAVTATAVTNPASEKVLRKTGFRDIGREGGSSSWEYLKQDWIGDG